jgi:hypothetical protein
MQSIEIMIIVIYNRSPRRRGSCIWILYIIQWFSARLSRTDFFTGRIIVVDVAVDVAIAAVVPADDKG